MGCLSVSASRIGKPIQCKVEVLNEKLNVTISRLGERLNVSAHFICTINKSPFLNVTPNIVWLSPDELASVDFNIISNVNWVID